MVGEVGCWNRLPTQVTTYHIFRIVWGQTGRGFEQPGFVGHVCAYGRELDLDGH